MRLHGFTFVAPTTSLTRLPVYTGCAERIQFKIGVLAHTVLHGIAPRYLGPLVRVSDLRVGVVSALPALIAWSCHHSNYPLLAAEYCCCSDMMERSAGGNNVTNVAHFS